MDAGRVKQVARLLCVLCVLACCVCSNFLGVRRKLSNKHSTLSEMLLPPRSVIITYEQQLLHDIVQVIIHHRFESELNTRGCFLSADLVSKELNPPKEWRSIFAEISFCIPIIRQTFSEVARSYGVDPKLIDFPKAVCKYMNYDRLCGWIPKEDSLPERIENLIHEPYEQHHGVVNTLEDYNRYLIVKAAQTVGKMDYGTSNYLFEQICLIMTLPISDFFNTFCDVDIFMVEPNMYRKYVIMAEKILFK